jgi:hypothetical protein
MRKAIYHSDQYQLVNGKMTRTTESWIVTVLFSDGKWAMVRRPGCVPCVALEKKLEFLPKKPLNK